MAFLFKSKKQQQEKERALASRDRDGSTSTGSASGGRVTTSRDDKGSLQRSTPTGSLHSLDAEMVSGSPDQGYPRRGPSADQQPSQQPPASDLPFRNGPPVSASQNASLYPWSQRRLTYTSSHPSPFPRYGAAVNSVASKEGDIYIMGGLINGATVKGDLWLIEAGGNMACYPLATTAEGPGPRVGHSSLLVGNAFIVFGGDTKIEESDVLDETLYLLNTSTRQWSRALPAGPRPSGRYGHSLNILGSKIFIFGGQIEGYFMNDLCAFDLNQLQMPNNRWEILAPGGEGSTDPVPQARTNHSVITYNDKLYLFGGTNGYQWFNDVWCYDSTTNKWSELECNGFIPVPREGHSAVLVDNVMYIFGGRTEDGTDRGDLIAFRIPSRRWYTFHNMGPSPSPRSGHSMTAVGKLVVVVGGEPSSPAGSATDLALVYVLDTTKIRYPTDAQAGATQAQRQQGRRPSGSEQNAQNPPRQLPLREGPPDSKPPVAGMGTAPVSQMNGHRSPPGSMDQNSSTPAGSVGLRPPKSAGPTPSNGPPPQGPAPSKPGVVASNLPRPRGQSTDRENQVVSPSQYVPNQPPGTRDIPRGPDSPVTNGRRTPTQQAPKPSGRPEPASTDATKAKSKPRSQQSSIDGVPDTTVKVTTPTRPASPPPPARQASNPLSRRSSGRNSQTVALLKELDTARNRNAWYASELELARKAGYTPSTNLHPTLESRAAETFDDEDKPLIEALLAMKVELANVQASVDKQSIIAAKQIAEAEKQRDSAIQEAVYSKARLAAYTGGSVPGTPQLDNGGEADGGDRAGALSKKLASALSMQKDFQAQIDYMKAELEGERRARQLADDTSSASQKRMEELELYKQQTSTELERLKSELFLAEREAREQSMAAADALASAASVKAEKGDLESKYSVAVSSSKDSSQALETLRAAVAASAETATLLEEKLESEREQREMTELKYNKLKAEHEARTAELVAATQRLRDAEELAEKNAQEARTHREAVMAGLDKVVASDTSRSGQADGEGVAALKEQLTAANALAKKYQQEVDAAAERLRAAEERIAGLEAYQEQASRDGVAIRRQLQTTLRETQTLQAANSDLRRELASQQLETNAIAVQHNTLKDILVERGISPTSASRSRGLSSPRADSPEQARIRDLERQLAATTTSNEEVKQSMMAALQASEAQYRDKLAQLEQDYNSAIAYLKTTEKMLKKLKDEHSAYKSENKRLVTELENMEDRLQEKSANEAPADWEGERNALQKQIENLQAEVRGTSEQLEARLTSINAELESAKTERDDATQAAQEMSRKLTGIKRDLEELQQENGLLEQRAQDAERKVALLLDQVESSVDNYRRQSRQVLPTIQGANGIGSGSGNISHDRNESSGTESMYGPGGFDGRNSMALDNLANELETLRSHWETTNKNYRLSNAFDFETSTAPIKREEEAGLGLSESLADWRKRLDVEEHEDSGSNGPKGAGRPGRP